MKSYLIFLSLALFAVSCGRPATVTEEEHEESESSIVSITETQIKTADIAIGSVEMKNLKTSIKANGTLTVPNQNKALVTSVSSGVIKTLLVQPGTYVKQGQTIATIINPDAAQIQQQLQATNAQIKLSELEYARQKELVTGNAAPLKNVQRVEAELATLRSTKNSLQKQLAALGISAAQVNRGNIVTTLAVRAPISGTISEVSAQIGSNVDASTPIAQIVNNSRLHLDLFVYEKDLPRLSANQTIHFTLTNNPGKEYDADIYSIGTAFANETKTIPVHAVVKGDKTGLIEGMNITAVISIGSSVVSAVPSSAIVSSGGQDFIFIVTNQAPEVHEDEENKESNQPENKEPELYFERIAVQKGVSDIGYTEIIPVKELPKEVKIVTKGAFFILAKMTNTGHH
ncbi:MAG: efflux RND transporter periplasmic adaptor subunit [Daejeonella sp.]